MKLLLRALLIALFIPSFLFSQTIQTGFVVVTPTSGTGAGLSVTETFGELVGDNFFQASVIASPLVTLTNIVVNSNPSTGVNTGIAMVNPNNTPVTVTMTLGNQQGLTTDSRTITLGGQQQVARFITEFFLGNALLQTPLTGLVFISSNLPIGVVGLAFTGFSFASLPPATQLTTANVITPTVVTTTPTVVTTTPAITTPVIGVQQVVPVVGVQNGIAAVAGTTAITPSAAVPNTINQLPATFPNPTPVPLPIITTPIAGPAPVTAVVPVTGVIPLTGTTAVLGNAANTQVATVPTTIQVLTPSVAVFPQINVEVGGPGAQLLPQFAAGAGWLTQITISNTSGVTQTVRVDFFNPLGSPLPLPSGSNVQNIVIAPTGVATVTAPTF
jgi:hypothetical protein